MFNNFLKSMMALCIVTSGFSSSSDEDGYGGSDIAGVSTSMTEGVVKPTPDKSTMIGFGDEADTKSPLNVGKSLRKTSDNSVQSKDTTVISSQKTSETESDANTSTSSEEGQSPQKERGVVTSATYANDAELLDEDIANKRERLVCKLAVFLSGDVDRYIGVSKQPGDTTVIQECEGDILDTLSEINTEGVLDKDSLFATSFYALIDAISSANEILVDKMPRDTIDSLKDIAHSLGYKCERAKEAIECIKNFICAQYY